MRLLPLDKLIELGWPRYMAEGLHKENQWRLDANSTAASIASAIRVHKAIGVAKRRRRLPKQVYPRLIEKEYAAAIKQLIFKSQDIIRQELLSRLPPLLRSAYNERADADEGRRVRAIADLARERMRQAIRTEDIEKLATKFADRTSRSQKEQLQRQVRATFGVDITTIDRVGPMLGHFVAENVAHLRTIPERLHDEIEKVITRAITEGKLYDDLAEEIGNRFKVSESQAELIARDQIGKLNGQLNAGRQRNMGVSRFIWRSVGDERVRDEHIALDGQIFEYDDPPDEGLPGEAILCRCSAEPIFDDILEEI